MKKIFFLLLLCTVACGDDLPKDVNGLRHYADTIETGRDKMEQAVDNWNSGDVSASFTAYLDGDDLKLIEEHMTRGATGRSINRYYFHDDNLFCYREARNNRDSTTARIEILFNPKGEVLAALQTQNGSPTALPAYVAPMAQKHAQTLRDLTAKAPHVVPEE